MVGIDKKIASDADKAAKDNNQNRRNKMTVLFYRWIFLAFLSYLTLSGESLKVLDYALVETLAVIAVYNIGVTIYTLKYKEKVIRASQLFIYLDIIFLTVIAYFDGGLRSEAIIFIFFLIGYCGVFNDAAHTIKVGVFSIIFYTAACIFAAGNGTMDSTKLIIRDFMLFLGSYGISRINTEVKKYDDLRKKEFKMARTDKLTGLANRHYFDQKLKEEVEYADQSNAALNVLIFDLDNFKSFNDTYGHPAGDKLLSLFSDIVRQCIRKSDIPVRYGGEEFLIIIRDLDIVIARNVGDRIRNQLEKQRIYVSTGENKRRVTVSCGIAQYPLHSREIKQVIEFADQSLYHAKAIGKNIVVTYDEIGMEREDAF